MVVTQDPCEDPMCVVHSDGGNSSTGLAIPEEPIACPNAPCSEIACIHHGVGTVPCPIEDGGAKPNPDEGKGVRQRVSAKTAVGKVTYTDGSSNTDSEDVSDGDTLAGERTDAEEGLERQPVPDETTCPYCGGDPTDDSERKHTLSAVGYLHDDIQMECSDCGRTWPCGVPIGEYEDGAEDLFCASCEDRFMRVHRVAGQRRDDSYILHLKCPKCYYFDKIKRQPDQHGVALIGYPDITGEVEGATQYGYSGDSPHQAEAEDD